MEKRERDRGGRKGEKTWRVDSTRKTETSREREFFELIIFNSSDRLQQIFTMIREVKILC